MIGILVALLMFPLSSFANDWAVAFGGQAKTLNFKRGMITYKGHQLSPIISIEKKGIPFMIAGRSLYYKKTIKDGFQFRSRIRMNSTGDRPSYYTETQESKSLKRDITNEWDNYLEHHGMNHYVRFQFSRDLKAYESNYFELHARYALYNYKSSKMKAVIQPSVFGSIGSADKKHNEYFYGDGASNGLNNYELGLIVASPNVIDPFWPTLKFTYFEILGDENRNASFVNDKQGMSLEVLFAFRVF